VITILLSFLYVARVSNEYLLQKSEREEIDIQKNAPKSQKSLSFASSAPHSLAQSSSSSFCSPSSSSVLLLFPQNKIEKNFLLSLSRFIYIYRARYRTETAEEREEEDVFHRDDDDDDDERHRRWSRREVHDERKRKKNTFYDDDDNNDNKIAKNKEEEFKQTLDERVRRRR